MVDDDVPLERAAFGHAKGHSLRVCNLPRRQARMATSYIPNHGVLPAITNEGHASLHTTPHHHNVNYHVASEFSQMTLNPSPAPPPTRHRSSEADARA